MQIGSTNTSTINIGVSGDTVNIPSGVTIANAGTATGFGETNVNLFKAYRNGALTLNHSTWSLVTFDTENFDVNSKYNVSDGKYTPASTGYYYLQSQVYIDFNSSNKGRRVGVRIYKNGSSIAEGFFMNNDGTDVLEELSLTISTVDNSSSASDYYQVYAYQNNSAGANNATIVAVDTKTYFTGYKLIT